MTNFVMLRAYAPVQQKVHIHMPVSVAIIEDLKEIGYELRDLFQEHDDFSCTQLYHTAEEAITFLPQSPPDIVITDIGLPGISGIQAIVTLRELMPETEFCMFTVFEDDDKVFQSLRAGAKGYILKNANPDKILTSAIELSQGGSPMSPSIARRVIDAFATNVPTTRASSSSLPLTDRELELLQELASGLLYKEIASKLGITIGTVKQHIHKIYHKLQVNNRTEAINRFLNR